MRTENDICLLCDKNNSTKKNSHIIPKFMGKSIFNSQTIKRAYILDTNRGHLPAEFIQDSAKEDYLFCPNCESSISIIETYMAERLHKRLWTAKLTEQFPTFENIGGVRWKVCKEINPFVFRLFIYSIVWRCSLSENKIHKGFKLDPKEEETLKNILKSFIALSQTEFLEKIEKHHDIISILPFVIYTAQSFQNSINNNIYTSSYNKNPYVLHLNEYILIISFLNSGKIEQYDFLVNNDSSPIKIGFFSEEFWKSENKRFLDSTAEITVKKAIESGQKVYFNSKLTSP